jgi:hypothetical protein
VTKRDSKNLSKVSKLRDLSEILRDIGPCLSSKLAAELVQEQQISPATARKRIERSRKNKEILSVDGIRFSHNEIFLFDKSLQGSALLQKELFRALHKTNSSLRIPLFGIKARGGVATPDVFRTMSGYPVLSRPDRLNANDALQLLCESGLLNVDDKSHLIRISPKYALSVVSPLRVYARLAAEKLLLLAFKDWLKAQGLISAEKSSLRGELKAPQFGFFQWDFTAPSYVLPLSTKEEGNLGPGFIVADIILGRKLSMDDIQPFLHKTTTVRANKNNRPFMSFLIADWFDKDAYLFGRRNGQVLTTPKNLFGEAFSDLLDEFGQAFENKSSFFEAEPDYLTRLTHNLQSISHLKETMEAGKKAIFKLILGRCFNNQNDGSPEYDVTLKCDDDSVRFIDVLVRSKLLTIVCQCLFTVDGNFVAEDEVLTWLEQLPKLFQYLQKRQIDSKILVCTDGFFSVGAVRALREASRHQNISWVDVDAIATLAGSLSVELEQLVRKVFIKNTTLGKPQKDQQESDRMFEITNDQYKIITPSQQISHEMELDVAQTVQKTYVSKVYVERNDLNAIVNLMVARYDHLLTASMEEIASRDLIESVLWQYTQRADWAKRQPSQSFEKLSVKIIENRAYLKALKFIAEKNTQLQIEKSKTNTQSEWFFHFSKVLFAAHEIVRLSTLSDQIRFDVLIKDIRVEVPSQNGIIELTGDQSAFDRLENRISLDGFRNKEIFPYSFTYDFHKFEQELNPVMLKDFGVNFSEIVEMLIALDERSLTASPTYNTKFVDRDQAIDFLVDWYKPVNRQTVERVLGGVTVTATGVRALGRTFYNPQIEHRALRRCFFEQIWEGKPHLVWVHELVFESFLAIQTELVFNDFPPEWNVSTQINDKIGAISDARGAWFEEKVAEQSKKLGIEGLASRDSIGVGKNGIAVVPGELDFIGWSANDNALILLENKMLQWAGEPKQIKNQIQSFTKKNGFTETLSIKASWIISNLNAVVEALKSENIPVGNPTTLKTAFITYEPLAVTEILVDFPCISLSEFVTDYQNAKAWPYSIGIYKI